MRARVVALVLLSACAASDDHLPSDAPPITPIPGGGILQVTPPPGNLLTCTGKVSCDQSVTWSTNPPLLGTSDASGVWHTPTTTTQGGQVFTLTATSNAKSTFTAGGTYHTATAYAGAAVTVNGSSSTGESYGVYPHAIAAKAARSYAVWPAQDGTTVKLQFGRSDDGGATWNAAATAVTSTVKDASSHMNCAAVAIDAGNPDVVYALARISGSNDLATSVGADGLALVLSVSADGGATFTPRVLHVGSTADGPLGWDNVGICPDLISPAADSILIESPGAYNGDGAPDMALWFDGARGGGFASGQKANNDYVANGNLLSLKNVLGGSTRLTIEQNGGTDDAGSATESPRLFGDGKGRVCLSYLGTLEGATPTTNTYVQCTTDKGSSWSAPLKLDPSDGSKPHSQPIGAIAADGHAAVVWTTGLAAGGQLMLATSTDSGATFATPVPIPTYMVPSATTGAVVTNPTLAYDDAGLLWLAYAPSDGSSQQRIVVDKSCDSGKTWSGAVLVNGPEATIANARWPAFAMTPGDAPKVFAVAADHMVVYPLTP